MEPLKYVSAHAQFFAVPLFSCGAGDFCYGWHRNNDVVASVVADRSELSPTMLELNMTHLRSNADTQSVEVNHKFTALYLTEEILEPKSGLPRKPVVTISQ